MMAGKDLDASILDEEEPLSYYSTLEMVSQHMEQHPEETPATIDLAAGSDSAPSRGGKRKRSSVAEDFDIPPTKRLSLIIETMKLQPPSDRSLFALSYTQTGKPTTFRLIDALPKDIPESYLQDHDKRKEIILGSLRTHFRYWRYADGLQELNLELPEGYCKQLEGDRNLVLEIMKIVRDSLSYVKSAKEVTFPSLKIETISDREQSFHHFLPGQVKIKSSINLPVTGITGDCGDVLCQMLKELEEKHSDASSPPEYAISTPDDTTIKHSYNFKKKWSAAIQREKPGVSWNKKTKVSAKKSLIPKPSIDGMYTMDSQKSQLHPSSTTMNSYLYWNLENIHTKYKGKGTVIAVVDTGIDLYHPAFQNSRDPDSPQIIGVIDFSDDTVGCTKDINGHGTACAGIACGQAFKAFCGGEAMIDIPSGVAPAARMIVCKVTKDGNEHAPPGVLAKALIWLKNFTDSTQNIDVVSISFGALVYSEEVEKAVTALIESNVVVVCAASNHGHKFRQAICFPARLGHVLCIGSHDSHGKPSQFSPVGQQIDFLAPGESIMAPASGTYSHAALFDGTSEAAPAIAGLVCLILECIRDNYPEAVMKEIHNHWIIKEIIREMGTNSGMHCDDRGYGALNPERFFEEPKSFVNTILREVKPQAYKSYKSMKKPVPKDKK